MITDTTFAREKQFLPSVKHRIGYPKCRSSHGCLLLDGNLCSEIELPYMVYTYNMTHDNIKWVISQKFVHICQVFFFAKITWIKIFLNDYKIW